MRARPAIDRFLEKIIVLGPEEGECWIWQASRGGYGYGYGQFCIARSKSVPAHRWSYEHFKGPIPDGLVVDHLCRRVECVNPDHLEAVTQLENARRGRRDRLIYGSPWGERGERFEEYARGGSGIQSTRLAAPENRYERTNQAAETRDSTRAPYEGLTRVAP